MLNQRMQMSFALCEYADIQEFERLATADRELTRSAELPYLADSFIFLSIAEGFHGQWEHAIELAEEGVRLEQEGSVLAGFHRGQLVRALAYGGQRERVLALIDGSPVNLPPAHGLGGNGP